MSEDLSEREKSALVRRWMHSSEEDTADESVYRPDSYGFPPARGRVGLEFRADGTCAEIEIAPADGSLDINGSWHVVGRTVELSLPDQESRNVQVVSIDKDRLVIKKQ